MLRRALNDARSSGDIGEARDAIRGQETRRCSHGPGPSKIATCSPATRQPSAAASRRSRSEDSPGHEQPATENPLTANHPLP